MSGLKSASSSQGTGSADALGMNARSKALLASGRSRFVKGLGASTVMLGISYLGNLLLVPMILRAWGPEGYSLWVTLFAAVSYLALLDLGGQVYVQGVLAMRYARNDQVGFRSTLSASVAFYLWLGVALLFVWLGGIGLGLTWPVPLMGRVFTHTEAVVMALLGASQFLISVPFGVFGTCYRASERLARGAMLGNVSKVLLLAASVLVLLMGGGPELLAAAYLGVNGISLLLLWADSRRCLPEAWPLDLSWRSARAGFSTLKGSLFNWLVAVSSLVNQQMPVLILANFAPPQIVALFATHRMIANIAGYAPGIVSGPILPEMSYLWSLDKFAAFRRVMVRAVAVMILTTGLVAFAVFFIAPSFFERWTVRQVALDWRLLALCLLQGVTGSATTAASWALIATNRHRVYSVSCVGYSLVLIGVAVLVMPHWGPLGLIACIVGLDLVFLGAVMPALVARVLPGAARDLLRACALSLGALAAAAGVLGGLWHWLPTAWGAPAALLVLAGFGTLMLVTLKRRWSPEEVASV